MRYKKFDDWFWETENYATRGERFFEELKGMSEQRAVEWLKSAWNCALQEDCMYCNDEELSKYMFDNNCTGCQKRMDKIARDNLQQKK